MYRKLKKRYNPADIASAMIVEGISDKDYLLMESWWSSLGNTGRGLIRNAALAASMSLVPFVMGNDLVHVSAQDVPDKIAQIQAETTERPELPREFRTKFDKKQKAGTSKHRNYGGYLQWTWDTVEGAKQIIKELEPEDRQILQKYKERLQELKTQDKHERRAAADSQQARAGSKPDKPATPPPPAAPSQDIYPEATPWTPDATEIPNAPAISGDTGRSTGPSHPIKSFRSKTRPQIKSFRSKTRPKE